MKGVSDQRSGFHGNPYNLVLLSLWSTRSWRRNIFRLCLWSEKKSHVWRLHPSVYVLVSASKLCIGFLQYSVWGFLTKDCGGGVVFVKQAQWKSSVRHELISVSLSLIFIRPAWNSQFEHSHWFRRVIVGFVKIGIFKPHDSLKDINENLHTFSLFFIWFLKHCVKEVHTKHYWVIANFVESVTVKARLSLWM